MQKKYRLGELILGNTHISIRLFINAGFQLILIVIGDQREAEFRKNVRDYPDLNRLG